MTLTALLDLSISSGASICSTMAFPTLEISDHVVVSVSIDSLTNSKRDTPFHHIGYEYCHADWDGHHDYLRDVPWEDNFKSDLHLIKQNCLLKNVLRILILMTQILFTCFLF